MKSFTANARIIAVLAVPLLGIFLSGRNAVPNPGGGVELTATSEPLIRLTAHTVAHVRRLPNAIEEEETILRFQTVDLDEASEQKFVTSPILMRLPCVDQEAEAGQGKCSRDPEFASPTMIRLDKIAQEPETAARIASTDLTEADRQHCEPNVTAENRFARAKSDRSSDIQPIFDMTASTFSVEKMIANANSTPVSPILDVPNRSLDSDAGVHDFKIKDTVPEPVNVAARQNAVRNRPWSPPIREDVPPVPVREPQDQALATVATDSKDRTSEADWSPIDLKTVHVDAGLAKQHAAASQPKATQATREDQLQAQKAVQQGFELTQRRAHYSARSRFIQALRIVARSLDDQGFTTHHSASLNNALAAYEEASDFFPPPNRPDEDVNLHSAIGGHHTPVLQDADVNRLTPRQCLREYMAYAEQEFTHALGKDEIASQAMYGLGRLEAAVESRASIMVQVQAHRALMLHQTALVINSDNFAAANELGVLLARYGKYEEAISALRHCVRISPEPTAWRNLANIHRRLGETEKARLAEIEASRALSVAPGAPFVATQPKVEWVDAATFARTSPQASGVNAVQPIRDNDHIKPVEQTANKNRFWPFGRAKTQN